LLFAEKNIGIASRLAAHTLHHYITREQLSKIKLLDHRESTTSQSLAAIDIHTDSLRKNIFHPPSFTKSTTPPTSSLGTSLSRRT